VSLHNDMPKTQYVESGLRLDRTKASKKYIVEYQVMVMEHM
jgi:hypothetical protein